mmetsp:Transcript_33651/g.38707  ORF Transcript_33651/g.38707 Transcript_33651/m.38707 type:complete len:180 (+) Transcript_33651:1258-1797(+)
MSKTILDLSECTKYYSKMYKLCDSKHFSQLCAEIEEMLLKWSTAQNHYSEICKKNLAEFFTYPSNHISALKRLESEKLYHQQLFEKFSSQLEKKKDKAFKAREVTKWDLSTDDLKRHEELLNDKTAAFKVMFPRDNHELTNLQNNYYFLANYCYSEIRRTNRSEMLRTRQNFVEFCEKN